MITAIQLFQRYIVYLKKNELLETSGPMSGSFCIFHTRAVEIISSVKQNNPNVSYRLARKV